MKTSLFSCSLVLALVIATAVSGRAAATLQQQIDQSEVNVGDEVVLTVTVQNGNIDKLHVPRIAGLQINGTNTATSMTFDNGSFSSSTMISTQMQTLRAGDITIPSFDVDLKDGSVLHTKPVTIHVLADSSTPAPNTPTKTRPVAVQPQQPGFNPYGPVVMPNGNNPAAAPDSTTATVDVPVDADGQPLKVFMVLTPVTTDAYVGQSVPMRIEFYIRVDVLAQQDSLPTIDGSDFMMNPIARPEEGEITLMNQPYHVETWNTAVSATKSGDFPMVMERDTYWIKSTRNRNADPFGNFFFNRPELAHEPIGSNPMTFHIHPLPEDGRPANFSGAIGHLTATVTADPLSVSVGEPVTLHFTISGEGNFNYVRCPSLTPDPSWKSYASSSKTQYSDAAHTQGTKTFEQAVIPQKNGVLPMPAASFSYFDPTTKQYVTTPVALPSVTVTGTLAIIPPPPTATNPDTDEASASTAFAPAPNRTTLGSLTTQLLPAYRQPWFWAVQGSLLTALGLSGIFTFMRRQTTPDAEDAARVQHRQSLHAEEDAMGVAARNGDAPAFFLAARHAIQLQLGEQWNVRPEALTLGEIRRRDPQRAEALEPLFIQADEVIYSGGATGKLDLAQWERHVRSLLQPQPQPA